MLNSIVGVLGSGVVAGDYQSISTTVLSSATSSITFSSIPSTYQHLQLRIMSKDATSASAGNWYCNLNGDTGFNYAIHRLYGNGATIAADGAATGSFNGVGPQELPGTSSANIFGVTIIDILDYASTNKNKTVRLLHGFDANGSGQIALNSGLWVNTAAVTSVTWARSGSNMAQYTHAALYGIKG